MKARKILLWAATGWTPMLIFLASVFVLYGTLHSHVMWVQLTGLFLCGSSGIFLAQTMPGGMVWLELFRSQKNEGGDESITADAGGHSNSDQSDMKP